ncbi:unnamed protein product, partial [Effrenium voratum]
AEPAEASVLSVLKEQMEGQAPILLQMNSLNLQCQFDAATVRLASALIAPVAPLLLLVCCLALEAYNGSGMR